MHSFIYFKNRVKFTLLGVQFHEFRQTHVVTSLPLESEQLHHALDTPGLVSRWHLFTNSVSNLFVVVVTYHWMSWVSWICCSQGSSAGGWGGGARLSSDPSFTTYTDSDCFLLKWLLHGSSPLPAAMSLTGSKRASSACISLFATDERLTWALHLHTVCLCTHFQRPAAPGLLTLCMSLWPVFLCGVC